MYAHQTNISENLNPYLHAFFEHNLKAFRLACDAPFSLEISGLKYFLESDSASNEGVDNDLILNTLEQYGLTITFTHPEQRVNTIHIKSTNLKTDEKSAFDFSLDGLSELIELASKSNLSVVNVLLIKIICKFICGKKQLFKAVVLDLDDTVWPGVLSEVGIEGLKNQLNSKEGHPFQCFMRWIKALSQETGIYIAVCSRNDQTNVEKVLASLEPSIFPLRGVIDCVIANDNNKSQNLKLIAEQLSISTKSLVFIDDNCIVRDEVRQNLPDVYVPEWSDLDDLQVLLKISGVFERFELSINSRNKKNALAVLNQARQAYQEHQVNQALLIKQDNLSNQEHKSNYLSPKTKLHSPLQAKVGDQVNPDNQVNYSDKTGQTNQIHQIDPTSSFLQTVLASCNLGSLSSQARIANLPQRALQPSSAPYLPQLTIKANEDLEHKEALSLYARSNQFKFINQAQTKMWEWLPCDIQALLPRRNNNYIQSDLRTLKQAEDSVQELFQRSLNSMFFELFRENGEKLGVASALSFVESSQMLIVVNWAISCHYFKIGLEESVLLYLNKLANNKPIFLLFEDTGENLKAQQMLSNFDALFLQHEPHVLKLNLTNEFQAILSQHTCLKGI